MRTPTQTTLDAIDGPDATLMPVLRGAMPGILARLGAAWRARRTRAALAGMDDRMLEDIGLTRRDAPRAAPSTALRDLYR